eukprot:gene21571-biopygen2671
MPACFGKARIARATTSYCTNYNAYHQPVERVSKPASHQDQANRLSEPAGLAKPSSKTMYRQVKEPVRMNDDSARPPSPYRWQVAKIIKPANAESVQKQVRSKLGVQADHRLDYVLVDTGGRREGGCVLHASSTSKFWASTPASSLTQASFFWHWQKLASKFLPVQKLASKFFS